VQVEHSAKQLSDFNDSCTTRDKFTFFTPVLMHSSVYLIGTVAQQVVQSCC